MKIVSSRESNINLTPVGVDYASHCAREVPKKGTQTIKKVAIKKKKCCSKKNATVKKDTLPRTFPLN